ncbi:hypothetical protein PFDSM3638_00035 [Pyrococcus furiosus DSM 3638]|nr:MULTISPECIES: hypothetical protein [Pyrococcus]AFN04552.1 hypothetical protein PFC_08100 [Pyrococcus furiosus COM1]MDK2869164.1 hypothetical protein [Pyrococcus sp.]QEK77758.1 hypothetical protein PFDSM3638_00035 [Pyrococcus furiosus DSM 3638]
MLSEKVKELQSLHRDFEDLIPRLLLEKDIKDICRSAYEIENKKIRILFDLLSESPKIGREFENLVKEMLRLESRMKGIIEDIIRNMEDPDVYIKTLANFNRNYDYLVTENLSSLLLYAEFSDLLQKEGGIPEPILNRIMKAEEVSEKIGVLVKFLSILYNKPSALFKVETSLRSLNQLGLRWVEIRHLERETGIKREELEEILEGLTLIGVVEKMNRGGESVYRIRNSGEDKGNI